MRGDHDCLSCCNWRPNPPTEWKPSYPGATFTRWELRGLLGDYPRWNAGWPGRCHLQPTPIDTYSVHGCGQWAVDDSFTQSWAGIAALAQAQAEVRKLKAELKA